MMQLLDLPTELMQMILFYSILARGVKRGVRLRLVCKKFHQHLIPTLYQTRLLDDFSAPQVGFHWQMRNDRHGSAKLWHDYLVYRVLGEVDRDVGRFVEIREAAAALQNLVLTVGGRRLPIQEIIHGLCWLALERGTNRPGKRQLWIKARNSAWKVFPTSVKNLPNSFVDQPSSPELNLLCAAAYFNEIAVATDVLQRNGDTCSPNHQCDLFPSAIEIAAFRGHANMLDLFQRHILSKAPHEFSDNNSFIEWACRNTRNAIKGAVINGNLDLLLRVLFPLCVHPHSPNLPQPMKINDEDIRAQLQSLQRFSTTPVMYEYLRENFRSPYETPELRIWWLAEDQKRYALYGNLVMLRHVVGEKGEVYDRYNLQDNLLNQACRLCYDDIVDFLLQQNLDPAHNVLKIAARGGSVEIMKKLLEHGLLSSHKRYSGRVLPEIIKGEHNAMLTLVSQKGYAVSKFEYKCAFEEASSRGLESMMDILMAMKVET